MSAGTPPNPKPAPAGRASTAPPAEAAARHVTMAAQLKNGAYECMICTETIRHNVATWSCTTGECYRVFHLFCVKKWAKSGGSGEGSSFRCPACQHLYDKTPAKYLCFCGKRRDPQTDGFVTPHSCGDTCGRRRGYGCPHACGLQCHPGPCTDCNQLAPPVRCPCGKLEYSYPCGRPDPRRTCDESCGKMLSCGTHKCERKCHTGPCDPCDKTAMVLCKCGGETRELPCGSAVFACERVCGKKQRCGNHECPMTCHDGACPPCDTDPTVVFSCPCGKGPLINRRKSCLDVIPPCDQICGRVLDCGNHECLQMCHEGPCKPCTSKELRHCQCASSQRKLTCAEARDFTCDRKCKARLSCGKHECSNICCPHRRSADATLHPCTRMCNKQLPCGHTCPDPCHRGACASCPNIVTDELSCACGAVVLDPPQACGTKVPDCTQPCRRNEYTCGHTPLPHNCHYGPCPPCTQKVDRRCIGGHTLVKAVMCSSGPVSCGNPCNQPLTCGHGCPQRCHVGPCVDAVKPKKCLQPCGATLACGHGCRAKCHAGTDTPCPSCAATEEVPCECGRSRIKMTCEQFQRKHAELSEGDAAHPSGGDGGSVVGPCSKECDYARRLEALESMTSGGGSGGRFDGLAPSAAGATSAPKLTIYSFNLWDVVSQSGVDVVLQAERHLTAFVRTQEKTLVLPAMSRERRAVVHELAAYFHVESEAVDREPNRTIVLTRRSYSRIPPRLLSECIGDPASNPETICRNVLAYKAAATKCAIVFEGEPEQISTSLVFRFLQMHAGCFVLLEKEYFAAVFPNGQVPKPKQGHKGAETIPIVAVFAKGNEAAAAFSTVRKSGCPATFHWFGESPPPTNFSNRELGIGKGMAPSDARYFVDEDTITPNAGAGSRPKSGSSSVPPPGASWATMARRETSRQKQSSAAAPVDTGNKFAALRR